MSGEMVTFTMPARDMLVRHIEDLQRSLTKRNAEIEALKQRLEGEGESEQMERAREAGFKRGWVAALNETAEATRVSTLALDRLRQTSWRTYLTGPNGEVKQ